MTDDLVTVRVLTDEEGTALFETACRDTLGIGAGEFLTAHDDGTSWDRWGHDEVTHLSMLIPFARREYAS